MRKELCLGKRATTPVKEALPDSAIRRLEELRAAQPDVDDTTVIRQALRVHAAITQPDAEETIAKRLRARDSDH